MFFFLGGGLVREGFFRASFESFCIVAVLSSRSRRGLESFEDLFENI